MFSKASLTFKHTSQNRYIWNDMVSLPSAPEGGEEWVGLEQTQAQQIVHC